MPTLDIKTWMQTRIKPDQIRRYRTRDADFIDDNALNQALRSATAPDASRVRDIIAKSRAIQTLTVGEAAALIHVTDLALIDEMEAAAGAIKKKVYDNRIVTFAPLYMSTTCVNNCSYCGFRSDNKSMMRGVLSQDDVRRETETLAGVIGHKRIIAVYGEHPLSDTDYIAQTMKTIYGVKTTARGGATGSIRRINVNAAPLSVEDLRVLHETGLGTYQVFQETYDRHLYAKLHPGKSPKSDFHWRLYVMHRAFEAGIDDVGIGALFGLYDWKFEVLGLLMHALELEKTFGIGPHTISFPRMEPAENSALAANPSCKVSDADFRRAVVVLRLAVPYTGMILTARENAATRTSLIPLGVTQTDASTRIGLGAYSDASADQQAGRQQFILGDTRSLDAMVRDLAGMGLITSFCTAGYRCGRTGKCIMDLLRSGQEGKFCKLNAVITYREWLDDFAAPETKVAGDLIIAKEIEEIKNKTPHVFEQFMKQYELTKQGKRDLYF